MSDFYEDRWGAFSQDGFLELSQHREFTGETWRVLGTLLGMIDRGNRLKIYPSEVADHLSIRNAQVTRQINLLMEKGVLVGDRYGWRLNPRYGFKGEPDKELRRAPGGELVLVD